MVEEGYMRESGRPGPADKERCSCSANEPKSQDSQRPGVRALIVAMKLRNGSGAKERRKVDIVKGRREETGDSARWLTPPEMSRDQWSWTAPPVCRERMLTALEERVKGGNQSLLYRRWAVPFVAAHALGSSIPDWVRPPTGEPDAGDPPVRFGGRGR
jgi:hypothetical protein